MEEILASIRRIIEESDTGRPDEVVPQPVNSDEPPHAAAPEPQPAAHLSEEAELPPREGIAVPRRQPGPMRRHWDARHRHCNQSASRRNLHSQT